MKVVYPFCGGDPISALLAFPDRLELTIVSLEQAGDPGRIYVINNQALQKRLRDLDAQMDGILSVGSNTSRNLSNSQRNYLPFQLVSFLLALVGHDYEPVALYYFWVYPGFPKDFSSKNQAVRLRMDESRTYPPFVHGAACL